MIRQSHLIAVVGAFLVGCAVLLVGCSGAGSGASQEEQGNTEAIKDQERSSEATTEEARCAGTQTFKIKEKESGVITKFTTNDVPGCPKGGLLSGTDKADDLAGKDGDDEIHGLGGSEDYIDGELGNDVIYGGPGTDYINGGGGDESLSGDDGDDVIYGGDGPDLLWGGTGEDVLYGGKGNDSLDSDDQFGRAGAPPMRDELYCGPGKDKYHADRLDYVDSSCEEKVKAICCFGLGVGDGVTVSWRVPIAPVQSGQDRRRAST